MENSTGSPRTKAARWSALSLKRDVRGLISGIRALGTLTRRALTSSSSERSAAGSWAGGCARLSGIVPRRLQGGNSMPHRWKETGGSWEPDHTLLSDEQLAKCTRAYDADADCPSPVPTRVVSNGEYMPPPQSETQKKVEARINELTETASKKLGVSRREFLGSSGGMAAAFIAMNEVHGKFFDVDKEELFEPAASRGKAPPKDLFVVDDQL